MQLEEVEPGDHLRSRPWYKRYPSDFIAATLSMTLEQKGAYSVVLDLLYDSGGPIPDDARWLARVCGCSTRKWNQIRSYLIDAGKLDAAEGLLDNPRAKKQRKTEEEEALKLAENGAKGAEKTNQKTRQSGDNKDLPEKEPPSTERPILEARGYMLDTSKGIVVNPPPNVSRETLATWQVLGERAKQLADLESDPNGRTDYGIARQWVADGVLERDLDAIQPVLARERVRRCQPNLVLPLSYYTAPVMEAMRSRVQFKTETDDTMAKIEQWVKGDGHVAA